MTRTRVIFVSRRDTLRSRLASHCLRIIAPSKFHVLSCGDPLYAGQSMHPLAHAALQRIGLKPEDAAATAWTELNLRNAVRADLVIVLDASMLRQPKLAPGSQVALWNTPDLLEPQQALSEQAVYNQLLGLYRRLSILAALPMGHADRPGLLGDIRDLAYL